MIYEGAFLPEYLSAKYLQPFISNELRQKFDGAILYISKGGQTSTGIDATILSEEWESVSHTQEGGFIHGCVSRAASGKLTHHKGFIWKFKNSPQGLKE